MSIEHTALGVIDGQRCFYPGSEADKWHVDGFGELPVPGAELANPNMNRVMRGARDHGIRIFTSQDWHEEDTAHFSENPNFVNTWTRHAVANTPGAFFHPELVMPRSAEHFFKGQECLVKGEDDTSYSAYNSRNTSGTTMPLWLERYDIESVDLIGIEYFNCVKKTAIDFVIKAGLEVTIIEDAVAALSADHAKRAHNELENLGVEFTTTDRWLGLLAMSVEVST